MEKAIEIKRRAQRFIQSGDLDGALHEYEKLVALPDCDPYNFVLLADLLFKRGEMPGAIDRYLSAANLYEKSGLYKNAIAVCKKMMRLALAPAQVLEQLANLHALDGLQTEAALYYRQFAEHLVREHRGGEAGIALRKAFVATPDDVALLEKAAEAHLLADENEPAAAAYVEAGVAYQKQGKKELAAAACDKAEKLVPGAWDKYRAGSPSGSPVTVEIPPAAPSTLALSEGETMTTEMIALRLGISGPPGTTTDDLEPTSLAPTNSSSTIGPPKLVGQDSPDEVGLNVMRPSLQPDPSRAHPPVAEPSGGRPQLPEEIDGLLKQAQEAMRAGDQDSATRMLMEAARAYESLGRFDNAATIYRSIARTTRSPIEVLERWLANAERRDARNEAAEVACQLGDHALETRDLNAAAEWFRHAARLDANNATAQRRLKRLEPEPPPPDGPPLQVSLEAAAPPSQVPVQEAAPVAAQEAAPAASAAPKVEMALGRGEAVSFDLGSLLGEFQRGIEAQLSGDAQGHYDLAMAYREMGLLDLAIESFRLALTSPVLASRATEMLGRSMLDQGRFEEAIQELTTGLGRSGLDEEDTIGLRYLLGLAYEAAGRSQEALGEFEFIFSRQPSFQDVTQKVRDARKALGS